MKHGKRLKSFTLSEVLITLGIIGIVASFTIPTLVNNSLKEQTVNKLKKFYTEQLQAIKLSELDNGPTSAWAGSDANVMFNTFLAPYIKKTSINIYSDHIIVSLNNGTDVSYHCSGDIDVAVYLNGYNKSKTNGKDIFWFMIKRGGQTPELQPFDWGPTSNGRGTGREKWSQGVYACNSSVDPADRYWCAGLILYDGWQIKSDYPYFN